LKRKEKKVSNHKQVQSKIVTKIDDLLMDIPATIRPFVSDYINSIHYSTSPRTRYEYLLNIKNFLEYVGETPEIPDLEKLKVRDFNNYLIYLERYNDSNGAERTNSTVSIRRKLTALRNFYQFLYDTDAIKTLEISKVKMPKLPKKKPIVYMDKDEVTAFLDNVNTGDALSDRGKIFHEKLKTRDLAFVYLMLSTGIRISECIELDVTDVDMKNSSILITRKGGNQEIIYFSDEASGYLQEYLEERENNPDIPDKEQALFISQQNKRLSIRAAQNLVKKYASVVPLKHITPHKLRSTYGTALYQETGDIYAVAEALGHSDVNTTKEHYAHLSEERKMNNRNKVTYTTEEKHE
jgi:Site-specific recombinase XerD